MKQLLKLIIIRLVLEMASNTNLFAYRYYPHIYNEEPCLKLFALTWLFDRQIRFRYKDCSFILTSCHLSFQSIFMPSSET